MSTDWPEYARPLFTTLGPSQPWTRESIDRRVAQAVEDGCDTVMAFVSDEGYALWPSATAPVASRCEGRDVVADWIEATHAAGLRFVAQWMGVHVQTVAGARHPSWFQRDARGTPSSVMCLNTPFGGYLNGQIREVAEGYPIDGVYLDGIYARQGGCYCDACRDAFEARFERPLIAGGAADPDDEARGGHWLESWGTSGSEDPDLATFRFDTVTAFLARLKRSMTAARPGAVLVLDTLGVQTGSWPNGQDLRRLRSIVDVLALECYPDQVHEPLWHAALETSLVQAEARTPIWSLRWISRDPDGDLVSVPPATLRAHVATAIAHATAPTIVEMNLYAEDESLRPEVRQALRDAHVAYGWREGLMPDRWAGVVSHRQTQAAAAAQGAARRAFDPIAGSWLALTEAHLPVDIVHDQELAAGPGLSRLATLVVPDVAGLTEAEAAAIDAAVRNGLGLVLTGRSSIGALGEALGIATDGTGHRAGEIGPEAAGGTELVNYVRLGEHSVVGTEAGRLWSYPGRYTRFTEAPGETLGMILDSDYGAMDGERWFGWLPGHAAWPFGVAFEHGAGRVLAWAAPLDVVFFRQGRPEAASLLASSARWTARQQPALSVDAPVTVECRSWTGEGVRLVALANRSTNDLYAIGAGIRIGAATSSMAGAATGGGTMRAQFPREILPLAGVSVTLDWDGDSPKVEALGDAPGINLDAGRLTLTLDRLDAYDVIRLTH